MIRYPVESSNLAAVGYDAVSKILQVEFKGGAIYNYFKVSPDSYDSLLDAESVGKYLNAEIKPNHGFELMPQDAFHQVTENQRDLDADGIQVAVSRQALNEVIQELHFLRFAYGYGVNTPELETIASEYTDKHGWSAPSKYQASQ